MKFRGEILQCCFFENLIKVCSVGGSAGPPGETQIEHLGLGFPVVYQYKKKKSRTDYAPIRLLFYIPFSAKIFPIDIRFYLCYHSKLQRHNKRSAKSVHKYVLQPCYNSHYERQILEYGLLNFNDF